MFWDKEQKLICFQQASSVVAKGATQNFFVKPEDILFFRPDYSSSDACLYLRGKSEPKAFSARLDFAGEDKATVEAQKEKIEQINAGANGSAVFKLLYGSMLGHAYYGPLFVNVGALQCIYDVSDISPQVLMCLDGDSGRPLVVQTDLKTLGPFTNCASEVFGLNLAGSARERWFISLHHCVCVGGSKRKQLFNRSATLFFKDGKQIKVEGKERDWAAMLAAQQAFFVSGARPVDPLVPQFGDQKPERFMPYNVSRLFEGLRTRVSFPNSQPK